MQGKTILLNAKNHTKLTKMKAQFKLESYDVLITKMLEFFSKNSLSITDTFDKNIHKELVSINKNFAQRDSSLRKWIGKIYQEELLKIADATSKILFLIEENSKKDIVENVIQDYKVVQQEEPTKIDNPTLSVDVSEYEKLIEDKNDLIKSFHIVINSILSSAKEQGGVFGGKKYIIELSEEQYKVYKEVIK